MESSSRQRKGTPRQRLRVRTDAGREVAVLLAAVNEQAQVELHIRTGQLVVVQGWWAGRGEHSILVATRIRIGDRSLRIDDVPRDEVWMPQ